MRMAFVRLIATTVAFCLLADPMTASSLSWPSMAKEPCGTPAFRGQALTSRGLHVETLITGNPAPKINAMDVESFAYSLKNGDIDHIRRHHRRPLREWMIQRGSDLFPRELDHWL